LREFIFAGDGSMEQIKTFGDNLSSVRSAKNITREELATAVGIELDKLILMEEKKLYPTMKILSKFVDVLKTDVGELIKGDQMYEELKELALKYDLANLLSGLEKLGLEAERASE
jgi:transcriptional regulator with XRE-family HTH domain